jgi:hypothetical protein
MTQVIKQVDATPGRISPHDPSQSKDVSLIAGYLNESSLHIRRTLDQFKHHGINTEKRDTDQVVYRYCKGHPSRYEDPESRLKIFMVDQLWIWILSNSKCGPRGRLNLSSCRPLRLPPASLKVPQRLQALICGGSSGLVILRANEHQDLVLTCFPARWNQPKRDALNLFDGVMEDINSKTRPPVRSVHELAALITDRCSGAFDRHQWSRDEYRFLEMFELSIGTLVGSTSQCAKSTHTIGAGALLCYHIADKLLRRLGGKRPYLDGLKQIQPWRRIGSRLMTKPTMW